MAKWLDKLLGRNVETLASVPDGAFANVVYNNVASIMNMTPETLYAKQPALHAVVDFLARAIAAVPIKCYIRGRDDTDRVRDRDSTAAKLLARPNETQTAYELIEQTVIDLKLRGFALWLVMEAESDSGWEIRLIPAAWVVKTKTLDGFNPSSYTLTNPMATTDKQVEIPAEWCIRFVHTAAGSPIVPNSPTEALKDVLAEQINAWAFRNQVWSNGGRLGSYIYRPPQIPWSDGAADRFQKEWREFSGSGASAGRTPVFEDGMELRTVNFNARETEWAQATVLSRQDVAGVYHVNPAMVWSNDGQTYASVKENARSLYVDTLSPDLRMISERLTQFLLPKIGADARAYVEFDIQAKLAGSFEEQAQQLQTAVGAPYMTREEARARMNLPHIDGADELVVPLNVLLGGQASPTDSTPSEFSYLPQYRTIEKKGDKPRYKIRGQTDPNDAKEFEKLLAHHFERQRKSIESALGKSKAPKADDPDWWDGERWDKELKADMSAKMLERAYDIGRRTTANTIGVDADEFSRERIEAYIEASADAKAKAINAVTKRQLMDAIDGDAAEGTMGATVSGVFDKAVDARAVAAGAGIATFVDTWAKTEAVRQAGDQKGAYKTWIVQSANPRESHLAVNGETVKMDELFSNDMMWPGAISATTSEEDVCGCTCTLDIEVF